jgi:hypothetical protein
MNYLSTGMNITLRIYDHNTCGLLKVHFLTLKLRLYVSIGVMVMNIKHDVKQSVELDASNRNLEDNRACETVDPHFPG